MNKISEWMDGELDGTTARRQVERLKQDTELRQVWDTFHLIGDVMRGERALSPGFAQRLADRLACPEYARPDRADRAVHNIGNILVAQTFDFPQRDRGSQLFRQPGEGLVHRFRDLPAHQLVFRRIEIAQLLPVLEALGLLAVDIGRGRRPSPQRHQVVLGGVDPDPVEPCVERAVSAKTRQRPVGLDKGFLRHVLHLGRIPDEAGQQPGKLALVLAHQQLERMLVAALRALDQLLIEFAIAHQTRP